MKKRALFILNEENSNKIYGPEEITKVDKYVDIISPSLSFEQVKKNPEVLNQCNIILSGWGGPCIDRWFMEKTPNLEAVFYGAGSLRGIVTPEFWKSGIPITSSWAANAIPVAEYTLAQIILCLKNTYNLHRLYTKEYPIMNSSSEERLHKDMKDLYKRRKAFGAYKTVVGIISLGMVGRLVCNLLKNLDVEIVAYDPYITYENARVLGVKLVSLEELFEISNVVSLHAPWLPETENMICGKHFELMKNGASFINTARGAIVNETEMINILKKRKDITAVLDVTYPEPPDLTSELFNMENVFLTPHIAGSMDDECRRMGAYAVDEMVRYLEGKKLKYQITEKQFKTMA
ncbi:MAG: hydroxyacid dehydrogenase [Clostridiales bacterium]|nr:hydroxyacid dehydrogenase [Clostridiales bacterium]